MYKSLQDFAKLDKIIIDSTQLHNTIHKTVQPIPNYTNTLPSSTQLYKTNFNTVKKFKTLHNCSTFFKTTLQTLHTIMHNFTQLYITFSKTFKTLHNFKTFTTLYTTPTTSQHVTQLYNAIHNSTKLSKTLHTTLPISTKLCTLVTQLYNKKNFTTLDKASQKSTKYTRL